MSRTAFATVICALALGLSAAAYQAPAGEEAREGQQPPKPAAAQTPAKPVPGDAPPPQNRGGQPINLKFDFVITDQAGSGEPARKTVSVVVADGQAGSVRSIGNQVAARLNVDVTPQLLPTGAVRAMIGLEYNPRQALDQKKEGTPDVMMPPNLIGGASLNQRVTVIVEPGKPLLISQAADPISERKITVEVRVTVLK
jgi:hypothetical protein